MSVPAAARFAFVRTFALIAAIAAAPGALAAKIPAEPETPAPQIEVTCAGTMVPAVVHVHALGKHACARARA